ncbi:MAG: hypothetical protein RLZZ28_738 [Bacteroidota bacterium]|jgi:hypothetical protein
MLKSVSPFILVLCCITSFAQQSGKKTYLITANSSSPLKYNQLKSVDLATGKLEEDLFDNDKKYSIRTNSYAAYQPKEKSRETASGGEDETKTALGGSVACLAYDAKSSRLFYVPLQLSELRFMDMKEREPSFTCLSNQSINLMHNKDDVANQITRMTIGKDGFGYALSNDGEHLIKFTTQGTPVIQDLGVLIDNPKNSVLVRSSCTSWGGDMVAGDDGNLYLVALRNHVFKISMPSKQCDYIGMIKNLPEEFTSNGASVDENGHLLISCGTSYGKKFSPVYKVSWPSLEASPVNMHVEGLGNVSDMASSNLLFQKAATNNKKAEISTVVNFNNQSALAEETDQLPEISIFPNPVTNGRFQIRINNLQEKGEYRMILLDANGKAIRESRMHLGTKTNTNGFSFPSQYAKGVYFVQIADSFNRVIYSQQLIVE